MKNKKNSPSTSAFDQMFTETGLDNPEKAGAITNVDELEMIQDSNLLNEEVDETEKEDKPGKSKKQSEEESQEEIEVNEDNSDIPDEVLNNNLDSNSSEDNENDDNQEIDEDEIDPNEETQVGYFFDAFAEANGWQVDEDNKPQTIEDLVQYMNDVVEENSKPQYSDPRVEQLDSYIKNGGSFNDFYNNQSQAIQYDSLDIEDESNQKIAIHDYLKIQGYDEKQIATKLERYEDADMLEDEATDAIERLKLIKQQELEQAQQQQELLRQQQEEQMKAFTSNLNNQITNLTNIRGVNVPKEDRKALYDYITRVDENGLTQYQKDFNKNQVKNLIESAYFTMKGDTLIKEASANGQTNAVNKLRKILRTSAKNHSSYGLNDEKRSAVDIASKYFG